MNCEKCGCEIGGWESICEDCEKQEEINNKEYIKAFNENGDKLRPRLKSKCPYCSSDNYMRVSLEMGDGDYAIAECHCGMCDKTFTEYFELTEVQISEIIECEILEGDKQ